MPLQTSTGVFQGVISNAKWQWEAKFNESWELIPMLGNMKVAGDLKRAAEWWGREWNKRVLPRKWTSQLFQDILA